MSMLPPNSSSLPLVAAMYNPPRPSSSPLLPNRLDPCPLSLPASPELYGETRETTTETRQRAEEKLIAVAVASPPTAASCVGCRLARRSLLAAPSPSNALPRPPRCPPPVPRPPQPLRRLRQQPPHPFASSRRASPTEPPPQPSPAEPLLPHGEEGRGSSHHRRGRRRRRC
ncbi:hypothetical protein DAI22_03g180500 [Oryza sativa Japonica Group]|nr:hypothetical protein DAI22_03g180500 [Oryza sativa Japonica Group]